MRQLCPSCRVRGILLRAHLLPIPVPVLGGTPSLSVPISFPVIVSRSISCPAVQMSRMGQQDQRRKSRESQ